MQREKDVLGEDREEEPANRGQQPGLEKEGDLVGEAGERQAGGAA